MSIRIVKPGVFLLQWLNVYLQIYIPEFIVIQY